MLVHCQWCNARVDAVDKGSTVAVSEYIDPSQITLLQCPQCTWVILVEQDYIGGDGGPTSWNSPSTLYPADKSRLSPTVPASIRDAFREAVLCQKAGAHTAAVIMARKCMEELAHDRGIAKRMSLKTKIERLRTAGEIEGRLFDWAEQLRLSGNDAAHGDPGLVSRDDAADILGFVEALVDYVYVYRQRFEVFKLRHETSKSRHTRSAAP